MMWCPGKSECNYIILMALRLPTLQVNRYPRLIMYRALLGDAANCILRWWQITPGHNIGNWWPEINWAFWDIIEADWVVLHMWLAEHIPHAAYSMSFKETLSAEAYLEIVEGGGWKGELAGDGERCAPQDLQCILIKGEDEWGPWPNAAPHPSPQYATDYQLDQWEGVHWEYAEISSYVGNIRRSHTSLFPSMDTQNQFSERIHIGPPLTPIYSRPAATESQNSLCTPVGLWAWFH